MTLDELCSFLEESGDIGLNESKTTDVQIALANLALKKENIPALPADFTKILKKFNGMSNEGSFVLGINTKSSFFPDLVDYNISTLKGQKTNSVILGYDDMYYYVFDYSKEKYRMIDKDDFSEEAAFSNIVEFLPYIIKA